MVTRAGLLGPKDIKGARCARVRNCGKVSSHGVFGGHQANWKASKDDKKVFFLTIFLMKNL